jgi:hypothetical protein
MMAPVSQKLESSIWGQGVLLFHGKICWYSLVKHNLQLGLIVQIMFFIRKKKKANQQCYKGHKECD